MFPDITRLPGERAELDEDLRAREEEARVRFARFNIPDACYGILIAHEGAEALRGLTPGQHRSQCSRGEECRGRSRQHGDANVSCRLVLAPCPWCD